MCNISLGLAINILVTFTLVISIELVTIQKKKRINPVKSLNDCERQRLDVDDNNDDGGGGGGTFGIAQNIHCLSIGMARNITCMYTLMVDTIFQRWK